MLVVWEQMLVDVVRVTQVKDVWCWPALLPSPAELLPLHLNRLLELVFIA